MRGLWLLPAALLLAIPLGADQTRHPTPLPESPHLQPNEVTTYVPPSPWTAAEGDPEPPASLVAHWTMDEESGTRADSLETYDLTDNNTVLFDTGALGNAASFVAANSESLTFAGAVVDTSGDFTVVTWAYITDSSAQMSLFDAGPGGVDVGMFLYTTNLYGWLSGGLPSIAIGDPTGRWLMCLYEYVQATGKSRVMAVGSLSNSGVWSATATHAFGASTYFSLGKVNTYGRYFNGLMDETMIFNQVLSADQITYLYGSGIPPAFPFAGFPE